MSSEASRLYLKGLVLTALGVVILSPDALLIRLIDASPWTILFWRGLGFTLVQSLIVVARYGGGTIAALRRTGRLGFVLLLLMGAGNSLFVLAITHTGVANALVIIAAAPLFAALMGRVLFKEPIRRRTLVAGVIAVGCVALAVAGGLQTGGWSGNLAALGAALVLAGFFNVLRRARDRDMLPALALAGFGPAALGLLLAPALVPAAHDLLPLAILCLVVAPVSFALISIGPRYLPAPEASLLMLLETILGPFLVWLVVGEEPGPFALIGGGILVATLAVHALLGFREAGRLAPAPVGAGSP
ncbi:MAG: DMT family transporter [Geminicoccaceae bacterium]|nr:DMT family transporter [Geminicoccaceae bacterium]